MATDNDIETMHKLFKTLSDAYQAMLRVNTMLDTLMNAHVEEMTGHICEIILEQTTTLSGVIELTAQDISDLGGA